MKAIVEISGHQYLVAKGDEIVTSRLQTKGKSLKLEPLAVFDESTIKLGKPVVTGASVTAEILEETRGVKTMAIRFKAKKRVKKIRGARQSQTRLKITAVSAGKTA